MTGSSPGAPQNSMLKGHAQQIRDTKAAGAAAIDALTTGLILQDLLQGFSGLKARELVFEHFAALPLLAPDRDDYVAAAEVRNVCRRSGLQVGTIDALLAQLSSVPGSRYCRPPATS